ncbi:MAG: type II toxin-antitoxin system PemK/MazF family toxin [Pseudomonadota bacterium]|nr:type II toxin-antitoxin system PemK/MazF family toxin [Pseudomonadota bacterium]
MASDCAPRACAPSRSGCRTCVRRLSKPRHTDSPWQTPRNGLRADCRLMVDKITTVPKSKVGARLGRPDDEDMLRLNQAVLVFLGLAASPRTRRAA